MALSRSPGLAAAEAMTVRSEATASPVYLGPKFRQALNRITTITSGGLQADDYLAQRIDSLANMLGAEFAQAFRQHLSCRAGWQPG